MQAVTPTIQVIYIDLKINDVEYPVALVEYTEMEGVLEKEGHIITRVWRDILKEGYTDRIVHEGFDSVQHNSD